MELVNTTKPLTLNPWIDFRKKKPAQQELILSRLLESGMVSVDPKGNLIVLSKLKEDSGIIFNPSLPTTGLVLYFTHSIDADIFRKTKQVELRKDLSCYRLCDYNRKCNGKCGFNAVAEAHSNPIIWLNYWGKKPEEQDEIIAGFLKSKKLSINPKGKLIILSRLKADSGIIFNPSLTNGLISFFTYKSDADAFITARQIELRKDLSCYRLCDCDCSCNGSCGSV